MQIFREKRGNDAFWWQRAKPVREREERRRARILPSKGLSKRKRFVLVALILTVLLYIIQRLPVEVRYAAIGILALLSYGLSGWSLRKDLVGVAWLANLIMPTLYPVAVALFYFFLPQQAVTRVVVLGLFAISMYALLLTANIFAVASNRTIQLLRAARTVGYLLSIVTTALLYHVIFTLRLSFALTAISAIIAVLPLYLQGMWMYTLNSRWGKEELLYAGVGTLVTVEVSMALEFWLIDPVMASVLMAMVVYVLLGLFQHQLERRLFSKTTQEYLGFAAIVYVIVIAVVILRWAA